MHGCRVRLEVTELLLLLGIQPPFTTSLFCRFVKAAVLLVIPEVQTRLGGIESPLLLLDGLGLGGFLAVWRNKRALKANMRRRRAVR